MSDLDMQDIQMFFATAGSYRGQSGDLSGTAATMREPSPVTPGPFIGRTELAAALNEAHDIAGAVIDRMAQGVGAYAGATDQIGNEYRNTKELSTELLGSVLNSYDRVDRATDPGGQ
jgi:hypothetical protein